MSDIGVAVKMLIAAPSAAYGILQTPPYGETYTMSQIAAQPTSGKNNCLIIPEVGIMTLAPQAVLIDQSLTKYAFPLGETWVLSRDSQNNCQKILQPSSTNGLNWQANTVASFSAGASFIAKVERGIPNGSSATGSGYTTYLLLGDDTAPGSSPAGGLPVCLILQDGLPPFLQYAIPNGSSWYWADYGENGIQSTKISDSSALFNSSSRSFYVRWMCLPDLNTLVVDIAGGQDRIVLQTPNNETTVSAPGGNQTYTQAAGFIVNPGRLKYYGVNGTAALQVFQMGFQTSGTYTSGTVQLPFSYQGNGVVDTPSAYIPTGTSVASEVNQGSSATYINYSLTLHATAASGTGGLALASPVITQVSLYIPPTYSFQPGDTTLGGVTEIDETNMSEVQIHRWLEYHQTPDNSFAIYPRCQIGINFNNQLGQFIGGTNGRNFAVQLSTGLKVWNDDEQQYNWFTANGSLTDNSELCHMSPQITGWCGMQTSTWRLDPQRKFDLIIEDRTYTLRECAEGTLPYFDGWCWRSAIYFLALAGGIHPAFIDSGLFPCPCGLGPNPPGCSDFKMPIGTALNPRVYFQPDRPFWSSIMEIAGMIHWAVGFSEGNPYGTPGTVSQLTGMPYYPGVYTTPNRGTITSKDYDYGDLNWLNTFIGSSVKIEIDKSDQRTGVALFGIDPASNLIQGTYQNTSDLPGNDPVTGVPWSEFTAAVVGFQRPLVNISSFNVDPTYTALYAEAALQKITMPTVMANWSTYYQPSAWVLDQYTLVEPLTIPGYTAGATFSVESKLDSFSSLNVHGIPTSSFRGRWVPNL